MPLPRYCPSVSNKGTDGESANFIAVYQITLDTIAAAKEAEPTPGIRLLRRFLENPMVS
jgi:hypothetical protein